MRQSTMDIERSFQSTLPMKGATRWVQRYVKESSVSIHAPNEGSDIIAPVNMVHCNVSIHAPNEGSDQ